MKQSEVARRIGRPRDFVFRLTHGQPLRDTSVIPELAKLLNISRAMLTSIVQEDARRHHVRDRK